MVDALGQLPNVFGLAKAEQIITALKLRVTIK